jgi:hypothetical protein
MQKYLTAIVISAFCCTALAFSPVPRKLPAGLSEADILRRATSLLDDVTTQSLDTEKRQELYEIIQRMRTERNSTYLSVLTQIIGHAAIPGHLKGLALRVMQETRPVSNLLVQCLSGDDDTLRAVALDLLALNDIDQPQFTAPVQQLIRNERRYSGTETGMEIAYIHLMTGLKAQYSEAKTPTDRVKVLCTFLIWLCVEFPTAGESWHISDTALSQYLVRLFRQEYKEGPGLVRQHVAAAIPDGSYRAPLRDLLFKSLEQREKANNTPEDIRR